MSVRYEVDGPLVTITIDRPERKNAVDRATAEALAEAFRRFDADPSLAVAVLTGAGGTFCAGADLKAIAEGTPNRIAPDGDGPMGPTRMQLGKPVIAAIEGHCVAGGLELACFCDLRVAASDAVFGVFCRRVGVPLIDGGTVRLPRLIGASRALDLILTGRAVGAEEALAIGLANRLTEPGLALAAATRLGHDLAALPQACLRGDRLSAIEQWALPFEQAMQNELLHGVGTLTRPDAFDGARSFASERRGESRDDAAAAPASAPESEAPPTDRDPGS